MSFVGKSSQGISGFSPTLVPDCVLWLDAADSNTLTLSGSNVTAWRDKSGQSNNSTGVINTPTYSSNLINGRPGIFISSNAVRGSFSNTISNNRVHCFMVASQLSTGGSYPRYLGLDDGVNNEYNSTQGFEAFGKQAGANFEAVRLNNHAIVNSPYNTPTIVTSINDVSGVFITTDGSAGFVGVNNGTTANFAISRWNVGCETNGSLQWNPQVYIGEILVYSNALSSNVRYQIEGYLARKWGLTANLPAAHPFKSLPPFTRPFQPTDISGCAVWLDGQDSNAMTFSGSAITQWLDKSGNGRHGSNAGTGNSTLGTTTTGRQTVVMGGSNYFRLSNASTLSATSASYFLQAYATGSNRSLLAMWNNERMFGPTYYWNNSTNKSISPYTWSNTNGTFSVIENSSLNTCVYSFNGNALTAGTYKAATANSNVFVGAHWSADNWWLGNIQEVIIYDGALTPGQQQQVETYLMNKWGTRGSTPSTHYARLAPALSLPFVPTMISNCVLWLDSGDNTTLTLSGSNVTQWNDKSGNGNNATTISGVGNPTYSANAVQFDGTQALQTSVSASTNVESGFFIVAVPNVNNASTMIAGGGGSRQFRIAGGTIQTIKQANFNVLTSGTSLTNNVKYLIGYTTDGTTLTHFLNGASYASTTSATYNAGLTTRIGGQAENLVGYMQEIILFSRALNRAERQAIEGFMARRWNTTSSLDSANPYKYAGTLI